MNRKNTPKLRFKEFEKADPWEQRKFVSVFDGLQNNTLSRAELNYESGTIKNVHYGDVLIKFGDYIDASQTELPYISDDAKADKFKNSFLQDGDIIIADTAEDDTVGKCTEIRGSEGMKLLSGLHTIACRPKEKYGPMFLGYYINSPAYHNQLKPLMQGIKVTSISKSALQDTDMIIPKSIDEQIKIGEYFSNLDNLITLHQRKYEKLKKVKNAYLDEMFPKNGERFPKRRFPGFTDPWEQRKLGEVSERVQGNDGRMDLPTLTISAANGWMSQEDRFSGNIAGKEQKNYTLLHKGELSYNHGNSKLAKYGTVFSLESYEEALVPRVYHSFRMIDADASFIEYYFSTKIPDRELAKLISSGARMDGLLNISFDEFMGIKINLPSIQEQQKISYYLRQLDNLITLHQRELDKLKKLKAAYLDAMFVGGK